MHLFHKWSKWEPVQYVYSYTHVRTGVSQDREVACQERKCLKCGKLKVAKL